jgi:nitroimidazol reductase NimA-like FMN-containing flavoprotein (pyridoxamine 5'-phosphate oxidase superfamily)
MPYQYTDMSQAQIEEFLQAPRFAIVGTNRRSGPPQLTPVWYLYENGKVYLPMLKKSV